jgi:hypothetical protein
MLMVFAPCLIAVSITLKRKSLLERVASSGENSISSQYFLASLVAFVASSAISSSAFLNLYLR